MGGHQGTDQYSSEPAALLTLTGVKWPFAQAPLSEGLVTQLGPAPASPQQLQPALQGWEGTHGSPPIKYVLGFRTVVVLGKFLRRTHDSEPTALPSETSFRSNSLEQSQNVSASGWRRGESGCQTRPVTWYSAHFFTWHQSPNPRVLKLFRSSQPPQPCTQ